MFAAIHVIHLFRCLFNLYIYFFLYFIFINAEFSIEFKYFLHASSH